MRYVFIACILLCFGCSHRPMGPPKPKLEVSPLELDFGESRNSLRLTIRNTGDGVLKWRIEVPSEGWLSLSQSSGETTGQQATSVDVRVDREGLAEGVYEMTLKVIGDGGEVDIRVVMVVKVPPKLSLSPLHLDFGETSTVQTFQVENTGGDTLRWTASPSDTNWISVHPSRGEVVPGNPITVSVRVDRSRLGSGTFSGSVDVSSERGGGGTVSLQVRNVIPVPDVGPNVLDFGVERKTLTLEIRNVGEGILKWTVVPSDGWISVGIESGETAVGEVDRVVITVRREGLEPGDYVGSIRVVCPRQEKFVEVRMTVASPKLSVEPGSLTFDFVKVPPDPPSAVLTVSNVGRGSLKWRISSVSQEWVNVSPKEGTLTDVPQEISVVVDRERLQPGTHGAVIVVNSDGGRAEVTVSVKVPFPPKLKVMPRKLDFRTDLNSLSFNIINDGDGMLVWEVSEDVAWMELSTYGGTTTREADEVVVSVSRKGLEPGTYDGRIRIISGGDTVLVEVTMVVSLEPVLSVSDSELDFGDRETVKTFEIANTGGGVLEWRISSSEDWIAVSPDSGTTSDEVDKIKVSIDRSGMVSEGSPYAGAITVTSNGGQCTISVRAAVVLVPLLHCEPVEVDFGDEDTSATVSIENIGTGTLHWEISEDVDWLEVSPVSGTCGEKGAVVKLEVDRRGLAPRDEPYRGEVHITSDGGDTSISVTLTVPARPKLEVVPDRLTFTPASVEQTVTVRNAGTGVLHWRAEEAVDWLTVSPAEGETSDEQEVRFVADTTGVVPGTYHGTVTITSDGGTAEVSVKLTLAERPLIEVSAVSLTFEVGQDTALLTVINAGSGVLTWQARSDVKWLSLDPAFGSVKEEQTLLVSVNRSVLPYGEQAHATITITSNGGTWQVRVTVEMPSGPPTGDVSIEGTFCDTSIATDSGSVEIIGIFKDTLQSRSTGDVKVEGRFEDSRKKKPVGRAEIKGSAAKDTTLGAPTGGVLLEGTLEETGAAPGSGSAEITGTFEDVPDTSKSREVR